ncbi:phosphoribosyl-AMP cyclohydrolase [Aestuariivirga litoralis]|uniref:Phosphoribosyl-AMP cyclohydrolase n=1 Tax=Aestuariivirga litoralis TaxID=2650924 RepID=A0A2W2BNS5_9HYPH|nr:phosphoribosyl-AMP cyclohydrolase [Aestuariivirga litoralis]PZF75056.1 phosphoribosyl-AMP cyclohydrolase [Aestuariivirga litoralis]
MASDLDETDRFLPRFDSSGLITAVVSDARDNAILMVAHMNAEALRLTQETGVAHFWSRSRQALWKKGETSGETLQVTEILTDCDQDVLLLKAIPQGKGAACHTGRRSCFYRRVEKGGLVFIDETRLFDPKQVY